MTRFEIASLRVQNDFSHLLGARNEKQHKKQDGFLYSKIMANFEAFL